MTGLEMKDGNPVGRDPREMDRAELEALGHAPMSATKAIRAHCLDCCNGSAQEVRLCTAIRCPSWPWRMGKNPWRAPPSEAKREVARRMAQQRAEARARCCCSDESAPPGGSPPDRDD